MHRLVCIKSFFTEILRNKQGRTVFDIKTMQTKNDVNKKMRIKRQMDLLLKNIRRKMRDMPTTVQKRNSQKNSCENPYRVKNFVCQMLFVNIFKYHLYRFSRTYELDKFFEKQKHIQHYLPYVPRMQLQNGYLSV